MSTPRFVYFDIDDTLLDHGHAERRALEDLISGFPDVFAGLDRLEIRRAYEAVNSRVWKEYAEGTRDKDGTKYGRFELMLDLLGIAGRSAPTTLGNAYLDLYGQHWRFMDGAEDAWETIADMVPVGLLTNGFSEIQRAKLSRFPILERHARHVVISEETGWLKPHPELFSYARDLTGAAPEEILYVGDSAKSDVEGGLQSNWRVAWFGGSDHPSDRVFCFQDWNELTQHVSESRPQTKKAT